MSNDADKDKKKEETIDDLFSEIEGEFSAEDPEPATKAEPEPKEESLDDMFGDLDAETSAIVAATAEGKKAEGGHEVREMSPQEKETRAAIAADMERNLGMRGIEFQVQSVVVEALADRFKDASPEEVGDRLKALHARMELLRDLQVGRLEKMEERLPDNVSQEQMQQVEIRKSTNKVDAVRVTTAKGEHIAVYKPRDQMKYELLLEDPHDAIENRARKEWLGTQIDLLFDVGRSPVATVHDAGPEQAGGAVIEYRQGVNGEDVKWEEEASDDEISRVADFHYLVWETDGHDGQYIYEADGRLTPIDRGEAFSEGQRPLRSEAITASRARKLEGNPDVLVAANRFMGSEKMRAASEQAFVSTFGAEEGRRRHAQFVERVRRYVEHGGVPGDVEVERTKTAQDRRDDKDRRIAEGTEAAA